MPARPRCLRARACAGIGNRRERRDERQRPACRIEIPRSAAMTEVLSQRALNRATLARQYLLERTRSPAIDVIGHLAGMQSQAPLAPYLGLWTRLAGFAPGELASLTEDRHVVRLHLMRNTVHLVSARDCLDWYPLFERLHAADFNAHFRHGIDGVDREALFGQARRLLQERPRTRGELGKLLAEHWPHADPAVLGYAALHHIALCQVPPRGIWGKHGPATGALVESWLGRPPRPVPVDELVLRYLGAFGPATVADMQVWSGLTRLREVAERLPLRTFRNEAGQVLYDLPGAPLPAEDTPAPPRFLPAYDNLLLSHKDRTRVIPHHRPVPLPPGNGATTGTVLLDGMWQGTWRIRDQVLEVRLFIEPRPAERDALLAEAGHLRKWLASGAGNGTAAARPGVLSARLVRQHHG
jgi:winged helix DNA-binding protein